MSWRTADSMTGWFMDAASSASCFFFLYKKKPPTDQDNEQLFVLLELLFHDVKDSASKLPEISAARAAHPASP